MRSRPSLILLASAALAVPAAIASAAPPQLERVVIVMRHGVRPPTKEPPLPAGTAAAPWPRWPVPPGELTPHGAAAVRLLGEADRLRLAANGLLPAGSCPAPGAVAVIADSDQRTIATADAYLSALAPGCGLASVHRPQDVPDPLFAAAGANGIRLDPAQADAAVVAGIGPGGIAAVEASQRGRLARLDRILCGMTARCGVGAVRTRLVPAAPDRRPRLAGALDLASTAAQILLLEHAEGKPPAEVGWGRADARAVTDLSTLHALEFRLLARPPYLAAANARPLARRILAALDAGEPSRVTVLVGHDTNLASLGGLFGLHWHVPGYAADDPPPGGAIVFELWRDRRGRSLVRIRFRAQSLSSLRSLRHATWSGSIRAGRCADACSVTDLRGADQFEAGPAVR